MHTTHKIQNKNLRVRSLNIMHLFFYTSFLLCIFVVHQFYVLITLTQDNDGILVHHHSIDLPNDNERSNPKSSRTSSIGQQDYNTRRYDDNNGIPHIPNSARSHSLPNAIPITRSIPRNQAENLTFHLSQRKNTTTISYANNDLYNWNHNYATDYRTLYLTNPSVLPLHNTIKPTIIVEEDDDPDPDYLSTDNLQQLTGGDPNVRYVAIYRACTGTNCFGSDKHRRLWQRGGEVVFYLAIVLLDEHLNIIPNTDILIDLNAGPACGTGKCKFGVQPNQDCRIFLLRGGIYLICNELTFRVNIRRKNKDSNNDDNKNDNASPSQKYDKNGEKNGRVKLNKGKNHVLPYVYTNLYGDGLEVTLLFLQKRWQTHKIGGKNFQIFRSKRTNRTIFSDKTTGPYDYYMQIYPLPHWYHRLNVPHYTATKLPRRFVQDEYDHKLIPTTSEGGEGNKKKNFDNGTFYLPAPAFDTPDVFHPLCKSGEKNCTENDNNTTQSKRVPFWGNNDRGTACCVSLHLNLTDNQDDNSNNDNLVLVGISHVKFDAEHPGWEQYAEDADYKRNQYLSRFVAYRSDPPFHIVARSGWFCLGFANENEGEESSSNGVGTDKNTLAGKNTEFKFVMFNETYNCPQIHFPSGFSEVVGDPTKAIITYGINDCHPRMIMVRKIDIADRLIRQHL